MNISIAVYNHRMIDFGPDDNKRTDGQIYD